VEKGTLMRVTRVERLEAVAPAAGERYRVLAFDVEATVEGPVDPATGMVINLGELKRVLRREVVEPLAGRCLDGTGGLPRVGTPESLAGLVWSRLEGRFGPARLARVRLVGSPQPVVERGEGGAGTMDVTRIYEFSASHRLHAEGLTDEENLRIFGKCNNPNGHGHNYGLEVTLRGEPAAEGELLPAPDFDRVVNEAVVDRWDHRHLNDDLPEFEAVNPTAEEIARLAWGRLAGPLAEATGGRAKLHRVKLRETARNHVEYRGEEE
jgi:6-pyruvoyltetrahydropterin/6-carboxytetrahydropterin synthase